MNMVYAKVTDLFFKQKKYNGSGGSIDFIFLSGLAISIPTLSENNPIQIAN
jgi:hypothetical protein